MSGKKGSKWNVKDKERNPRYKEYYQKLYLDLSEEECELRAIEYKKSLNWQCIEFYIRKNPEKTLEECEKLRQEAINNKKKNDPNKIEYWQTHYPELTSKKQGEKRSQYSKSKCFQSKEYYKEKYPHLSEEEQEKLRQEKIKDYTSKFDISGEKNGMHRSKRTEQQLAENCPWKIEFYQKHYPDLSYEEQENLRQNMINKTQSKIVSNCSLEYYLNKGMSEQEAKEALAERQATCRLDKFIKRYGEEGFNHWLSRQSKWKSSIQQSFIKNRGTKYIIQSNFAIEIIINICHKLKIEEPKKELALHNEQSAFLYDFNYNNKIIEFNGDFWHANPKKYSEDWINPSSKQTAKEIWEHEAIKRKTAEDNGYQILYIWESEYKEDPKGVIQKCIDFLKS